MQPYKMQNAFLKTVVDQVRWKQAHPVILKDLLEHLEDQAETLLAGGMTEEEADAESVRRMGDPVELGARMDASYRPQMEWRVLLPLGLLVLLGVVLRVLVDGARMRELPILQLAFVLSLALGVGGFLFLYNVNLFRFARFAFPAYWAAVGMLFVFVVLVSCNVFSMQNGAPTGFVVNVMQFVALAIPLLYAGVIYRFRGRRIAGLLLAGASYAVPLALCMGVPFASIACYMTLTGLAMLTVAIAKGTFGCNKLAALAISYGAALSVAGVAVIAAPYRFARFLTLLDPARDPEGLGWWTLRIREVIAGARWFGTSAAAAETAEWLGFRSAAQAGVSTQISPDYLLTFVLYRYGWAVTILILALFLAFFVFVFVRCARQRSVLGRLVSLGAAGTLFLETASYVAWNLGAQVFSAIALPFVSCSNTALVANLWIAGLLLSTFRTDTLYADTPVALKKWKRPRITVRWE